MRARSPAEFAVLTLAIAVASSALAADRCTPPMAPGYAGSADERLGPTGVAIDVVLDRTTVKYLAPDITADIAHGDCDSCLGYQGGKYPFGLLDFRIDAGGYLYILENINDKILILDDHLRFHRTIQLDGDPDRFGEVGSMIYVEMMARNDDWGADRRIVDRMQASVTRFDPDTIQAGSDRSWLWLASPRRFDRDVIQAGQTKVWADHQDSIDVVFCRQKGITWNIARAGTFNPLDHGTLMCDHLIDDTINIMISHVRSFSPYHATGILYRIDVSGEVAGAIDLSPAFETDYPPMISYRVGPDNSVVIVEVTDEATHIRRWSAR